MDIYKQKTNPIFIVFVLVLIAVFLMIMVKENFIINKNTN